MLAGMPPHPLKVFAMRKAILFVSLVVFGILPTVTQAQSCYWVWQTEPVYYVYPTPCYSYGSESIEDYDCVKCLPESKPVYEQKTRTYETTSAIPRYSAFAAPSGVLYGVNIYTGQVFRYSEEKEDWVPLGKSIP
jgi:hypothetical protein